MRRERSFWVIGGDMRQAKLAELLAEDGHGVHTFGLERAPCAAQFGARCMEEARLADCIILPLPISIEGTMLNAPLSAIGHPVAEILDALRPGQIVCGGMVGAEIGAQAADRGLELTDYFTREELTVANAVPTAEGAVQLAMEELPITVLGARVLVIGYGRVGHLTAHRLGALGARVTVAARKYADLAWGAAYGYQTARTDELTGLLCGYDMIINTVPARVLGEARLAELKPGCLVLDLASKPGGVGVEMG